MSASQKPLPKKNTSSTEYCKQGLSLCRNGRYPVEAIRIFRLAIKQNPQNPRAYELLGNALLSLKRFSSALTAYRKCITLAPHRLFYHYNSGKAYYGMGKYHLAITEYRKVLNYAWSLIGGKKVTNAGMCREISFAYLAWNKPREALWCYEKSLSYGDYFEGLLRNRLLTDLKKRDVRPKEPVWAK